MTDLGEQSDALNRRINEAGGTDPLMRGLMRSVKRTRSILIVALFGLVVDLTLTIGLTFGLIGLHSTDVQARQNASRVAGNTDRICQASNKASRAHNELVDALLAALANGTGLPPAEREARAARYSATRVDIIRC